jgi:hypothetical protein
MCNHSTGADTEYAVRRLLVRRDPTASVAPPAELRERGVEPLSKSRQNNVRVVVDDADVAVRTHQNPRPRRKPSRAVAVMSDWRMPSCGAATRKRSSRFGGSRVEN